MLIPEPVFKSLAFLVINSKNNTMQFDSVSARKSANNWQRDFTTSRAVFYKHLQPQANHLLKQDTTIVILRTPLKVIKDRKIIPDLVSLVFWNSVFFLTIFFAKLSSTFHVVEVM